MKGRIPVMFDRAIRPEWLDYALDQYLRAESEDGLRRELRAYLAPQIAGQVSVEKIARQLQRCVGFKSPLPQEELRHYHARMTALAPKERGALRLELLMVTTPFLADCLTAMRRLAVLGTDGVTLHQMYERLTTKYGDRSMVPRRVRYVLQTLALLGVIENKNRKWFLADAVPRQVLPQEEASPWETG